MEPGLHSHEKKYILPAQMSKIWKEMDFVRKDGWKEVAGGLIRANLENLYDIASAARAPEHGEDIAFLGDQRWSCWMTTGPINAATNQRWCRQIARQTRRTAREPNPRAASAKSSVQPILASEVV